MRARADAGTEANEAAGDARCFDRGPMARRGRAAHVFRIRESPIGAVLQAPGLPNGLQVHRTLPHQRLRYSALCREGVCSTLDGQGTPRYSSMSTEHGRRLRLGFAEAEGRAD